MFGKLDISHELTELRACIRACEICHNNFGRVFLEGNIRRTCKQNLHHQPIHASDDFWIHILNVPAIYVVQRKTRSRLPRSGYAFFPSGPLIAKID